MKRKITDFVWVDTGVSTAEQKRTTTDFVLDLPDDCWECVLIFLNEEDRNEEQNNRRSFLNSLSLVSKRFFSITNRHKLSLRILRPTLPFLHRLFHRFTNLTSLDLSQINYDLNDLLIQISSFPLNRLTSLDISNHSALPAIGLRAFSSTVSTTLTTLTCRSLGFINIPDDFKLISDCFPLLQNLDISSPKKIEVVNDLNHPHAGKISFSLIFLKLRKINLSRHYYMNDEFIFHLFENCKFLEEFVVFNCGGITNNGIAYALRHTPNMSSLFLVFTRTFMQGKSPMLATSYFIDSLTSLKALTSLCLVGWRISDHLLSSIAKERPPLKWLDLGFCTGYTYSGILPLLSNCPCIEHLNLEADFLTDHHVAELSSFLGNLVSINLSNYRLTDSSIFALIRNCPSLSEIRMPFMSNKENSLQNSKSLMDSIVYPQIEFLDLGYNDLLRDENIIMYASIFLNLQFLNFSCCPHITEEAIGQVLRRCRKIRHLNLYRCSKLKSLGINFELPKLEVLDLSNTSFDDEALYIISKWCRGLLQLSLQHCKDITKKGVMRVAKNCTKLRDIILAHCPAVDASVVKSMLILRPSLRKIAPPPDFPLTDRNRKRCLRRGCILNFELFFC